jgi:hypothetical protein
MTKRGIQIIPNSPIPISPLWQSAADPFRYGVYGDMIEALLPVAIVCAISLLGTAVWLLAVGTHLRSGDARRA